MVGKKISELELLTADIDNAAIFPVVQAGDTKKVFAQRFDNALLKGLGQFAETITYPFDLNDLTDKIGKIYNYSSTNAEAITGNLPDSGESGSIIWTVFTFGSDTDIVQLAWCPTAMQMWMRSIVEESDTVYGTWISFLDSVGVDALLINGSNAMTNDLNAGDNNIINVADATEDHHALPKGQADSLYASASSTQINWINAAAFGAPAAVTGQTSNAVCHITGNDFAVLLAGTTNTLSMYRVAYPSGTPALVGSALTISGLERVAITRLNDTDVVLYGTGINSIRLYRWGGSSWSLIGSGLTITVGSVGVALTTMNSTHVMFIDCDNDTLRLYNVNTGTGAFTLVGSGTAVSGMGNRVALAAISETKFFFSDSGNDEIRLYEVNIDTGASTLIDSIAAPAAGDTEAMALACLNDTDVIYGNIADTNLIVYRDAAGSVVQAMTPSFFSITGGTGFACGNGRDVVIIDGGLSGLKLARLQSGTGQTPYRP